MGPGPQVFSLISARPNAGSPTGNTLDTA